MSTQGYSAAAAAAATSSTNTNNNSASSLNVHAAAFDGNFVLQTSGSSSMAEQKPQNTTSVDDHVDSALLSAMRDPRERVALLKLEQAMLDFMKEKDLMMMKVGGPYNSMVVGLGGRYEYNNNNNSDSYGPNMRQTSFQRCWLHRLCDRFGVTRETHVSNMDGLIRLLKQPDSCVPKKLLIDLEPSEYALNASSSCSNILPGGDTSMGTDGGIGYGHQRLSQSMGNLSMASSSSPGVIMMNGSSSSNAKPGKMKIMKRNSSGSLNGLQDRSRQNNNHNSNKNSPRKSKKNLSDKEKEYAAARARIFNESSSESTTTGGAASDQQKKQQQDKNNNTKKKNNSNATQLRPSQVSAGTTGKDVPSSPAKPENRRHGSRSPNPSSQNSGGDIRLQRPKAATMGGPSKVTWRNRQKEEKDPDFQRGLSSGAPVYAPIADGGGYYGGPPSAYPPPTPASPAPYGYPGAVNGQQQQQATYGGAYGPSTAQTSYYHHTYGRGRGSGRSGSFRRSNSGSGDA